MAVVTSFHSMTGTYNRHSTETTAGYAVFGEGPKGPMIQINTYGSKNREYPNKASQHFQLDKDAARQLWDLLSTTYGFKS